MTTGHLLDTSKKYVVLGIDEKIWFFAWEGSSEGVVTVYGWQAYTKAPGQDVILPDGSWAEDSVFRFLTKHLRKLTDSDRIDLYLYLRKGGFEAFLAKNRIKVNDDRAS